MSNSKPSERGSNLNVANGFGRIVPKGPNSDYVSHGTKVTNTGELSICEVPNAGARFQPTTCIDKQWTFADFGGKWIDVGTILITPTATAGTILHSYSLPHDIKVSEAVKVPFNAFVYYRCNVLMQFTFPTLLFNQGQLRVFFVPGNKIAPGAYGRVNASFNQGFLMNMSSGKGGIITCTYNNYYNYLNTSDVGFTSDEVTTIGSVIVMVMQPYRGAASTPMSVKALITQGDFRIPRNISLAGRKAYAEDNEYFPYPPKANLSAEEWDVYRLVFGNLPKDNEERLRIMDVSRPSVHDVGKDRSVISQCSTGVLHKDDENLSIEELNAAISRKTRVACVTFVNQPFTVVDEGCCLIDSHNFGVANQGLFDFVGDLLGLGGGGGNSVHNDNTYDARTYYNVQGNLSGGIRQDNYKGGDALDERTQMSQEKSDSTSLGLDATVPMPMDKPNISAFGLPVFRTPMMWQANTSGIPTGADYMDFEAYANHKFSLVNLGILADEMSLRAIMSRPTIMGSGYKFSITSATVAGSHLLTIPITPCPVTFNGSIGAGDHEVSSLEYIMLMFAAWKGTINYTFQFSKSGFGRARVFFASSYGDLYTAATPAITDNKSQYVADLDLSDAIETYTVEVPYMSNLDAMNVSGMMPFGSTAAQRANALARCSPGNIHVYALTPANSPDGSLQTIDCDVYIWANVDMAWAHPAVNTLFQPALPTGPTLGKDLSDPNKARALARKKAEGVTNQIGGSDVFNRVIDDDEEVERLPHPQPTEEGEVATANAQHPERYDDAYIADSAPHGVKNQVGLDDFVGSIGYDNGFMGSLGFGKGGRGRGGSRGGGKNTSSSTGPQSTKFGNMSGGPSINSSEGETNNVTNNRAPYVPPRNGVQNQIADTQMSGISIGQKPMEAIVGNRLRLSGDIAQIGSSGDGPSIATLAYSDTSGDMSVSADMLLANGGIDQAVAPPVVATLQPDPITAVYKPMQTVDTTTKFGVTPALPGKSYFKRMTTVATVGLGQCTISVTGNAAENQTVSFIAIPIHTGAQGLGASMASWLAPMYNYWAGTIIYQFQVVFDKTNRKNDGLVFKAATIPINSAGYTGNAAFGQAFVNAMGRPFLAHDPENFVHENQPMSYMTDDCHVFTVRVPYNNQGTYMRPYQLYNQDHGSGAPTKFRPFIYKDLAGTTQYALNQVKDMDFERYCSGALVFGIDNGSVMDLTAIPAVKVMVRMCLGDDFRFGRIFQIPQISYADFNRNLIPMYGPLAAIAKDDKFEQRGVINQMQREEPVDGLWLEKEAVEKTYAQVLKSFRHGGRGWEYYNLLEMDYKLLIRYLTVFPQPCYSAELVEIMRERLRDIQFPAVIEKADETLECL